MIGFRMARLLVMAAALPVIAAGEPLRQHTVQCGGRNSTFAAEGIVTCEEKDYHGIHCPAEDVLVIWRAPDGAVLRAGDPIYSYSTERRRGKLPVMELEFLCAERDAALKSLELQRELAKVLREQQSLGGELAVSEAALADLVHVDDMEVELLRRELERERGEEATCRQAHKLKRTLHEAGNASQSEVNAAEIALRRTELKTISAESAWLDAARKVDLTAIRLKELEIEQIRKMLGEAESNSGIAARIAALETKLEGQREQLRTTQEKAEFDLHREYMLSYDHVPLGWVELRVRGEAVRRISFQPAASPIPTGWLADTGAVHNVERGYGWDSGRPELLAARDGADVSNTVAIVRNQATWRCSVPTGGCNVVIGIGDDREWHGLLVRANGDAALVVNKLEKEDYRRIELPLPTDASELLLQFGGPHILTGRAEVGGVLKTQPWSPKRGEKTHRWSVSWPSLYVTRPETYFVEARVPRELAEFTRPADTTNDPPQDATGTTGLTPDSLRALVAAETVSVLTPDGLTITGTVHEVGTEPMPLSFAAQTYRDEAAGKKATGQARGVKVRFAPHDAARLRIGARARVQARIVVPDSVPWVPSQYVERRGKRDVVTPADGNTVQDVEGLRAADTFMITAGLRKGDCVVLPDSDGNVDEDRNAFEGRVVPGKHTLLCGPSGIWGRIKSLIPDGSHVKEGDWIMTLYDPFLDERRKTQVHDKRLAQQRYAQAAEERRLKAVTAAIEHETRAVQERIGRLDVRAIAEVETVKRTKAANAYRSSCIAFDAAQHKTAAMRASRAYPTSAVRAAERLESLSRIARDKEHLNYVSVLRNVDRLEQARLLMEWNTARRELGIRDLVLGLARQEEEMARTRSRIQLEVDLGKNEYEQRFEKLKTVYSPADGRLFYKRGYSWVKEEFERFGEGSEVWGGRPFGQILDMNELALTAELPENLYHRVQPGIEVVIRFDHLNRLELSATVQEVGRAFYMQKQDDENEFADDAISNSKYFKVTVAFSPPERFQERLMPGTKGHLVIVQ